MAKSSVLFSKRTSQVKKDAIQRILGVQEMSSHRKYLGMPSMFGRARKEIFQGIRDNIWRRINGWSERFRVAVLQAIPTFVMSCFLIPRGIIDLVEGAIRRFW